MNKKDLYKEIGLIDDELVEEALAVPEKKYKHYSYRKIIAITVGICVFLCSSVTALAVNYVQKSGTDLYIRYLSPENIDLNSNASDPEPKFDADKFFDALHSGNAEYQYIAINRLVECYNDDNLRKKAIEEIKPFMGSQEKKLADAAAFSMDVLSKSFKSDLVYKLADGSIYFTLFNHYSDYGSYNELWRIQDGKLEKYLTFDQPSMYITRIIPSPDKHLLAVTTGSNKSSYIVLLDPMNQMLSPELMDSARIIYGQSKSYPLLQRIDHENYSSIESIAWKSNQQITFNADMSFNDAEIIDRVTVEYDYPTKKFDIKPNNTPLDDSQADSSQPAN